MQLLKLKLMYYFLMRRPCRLCIWVRVRAILCLSDTYIVRRLLSREIFLLAVGVVYRQGRSTIFRMPIYPMLNQCQWPKKLASDWTRAINLGMNIDENIFRMHIYPMLNNMNIDELNISFYVKPRPLHCRSSHTLLTTIVLLTAFDHISTNIVARWRLLLRSSATRWRLVYVPRSHCT